MARRAQPDRPQQLAALERPVAVDAVGARVAGAVVDRAQEQGGVRVRDVREVRRLVAREQRRDPLGDGRAGVAAGPVHSLRPRRS